MSNQQQNTFALLISAEHRREAVFAFAAILSIFVGAALA